MKWKNRNLRDLAHIVCGDTEHFRYRSSSYITEFFQDCDLDEFAHDGSTRWAWVSDRLVEVLAMPHSGPTVPPDAFVKIIRSTLDKGDAQDGDPDRSKALATMNVVLAREGWQGFYDENGVGQLRHIATNTIAQITNPHRPFTPAELERREQLTAYLDKCSEDELIEEVGRSVRGEKDYSVIVIVGSDITRLIRDRNSRQFLSPQMATQIEIGLEIAEMARQEIDAGVTPAAALNSLLRQCLGRDEGWKAFYVEQMAKVKPAGANERILRAYAAELMAEQAYNSGDYGTATESLQSLLDKRMVDSEDKGWYLQQMARYNYRSNRPESQRLQVAAHLANRLLLKPSEGVTIAKLTLVSQGRMDRIATWVRQFETYAQLDVALSDILGRLVFGTKADKFEEALDELSRAIGFAGERPDKEWKEGPDNLWALDATQYIMWECKNEVEIERSEINKREAEQMNRSSSWFEKHYAGMKVARIMIHPAYKEASAASFTHEVLIMRESELKRIVKALREFFKSFEALNFNDLSAAHIQKLVNSHGLSVASLLSDYTKKVKSLK